MTRLTDEDVEKFIERSYEALNLITKSSATEDMRYAAMSTARSNLVIVELLQRLLEDKVCFNK